MSSKTSVAVIGAGLGGLCAAIKLKEAGFDNVTILEKAEKVGGTWRDNSYPGCACDTPVALYQFSFAPSLGWSHLFPRAPEVQAYTEYLTDNFGLRPDPASAAPLAPGQVRVRMRAVGLNFRDVLVALGTYPDPTAGIGASSR